MPSYTFGPGWTALLPTGTKIDPQNPSSATYFDPDQTALVLRDEANIRRIVVATTFGDGSSHKLGDLIFARHDQRCSNIGTFRIIGKVTFAAPFHAAGEVAVGKKPHWVFK